MTRDITAYLDRSDDPVALLLASHLQWGMMSGMIEKRRVFEAYIEPHVNRPAAKRADEQIEKLTAQQAWKAA